MNPSRPAFLAIALCLAGVGVFLALYLLGEPQQEPSQLEPLVVQIDRLVEDLDHMSQRMATLEQRLEALPMRSSSVADSSLQRGIDSSELERLVAAAIAQQMEELGMEGSGASTEEDDKAMAQAQLLDRSIGLLLDSTFSQQDREALWDELKEQGLLEQAIALLEDEVAGNPEDLDLLNQLGYAYLQPIIRGGVGGMDAGKWSMKADQTYDLVLAADPENWEARFSKAISYSFWPPMFGKQPEAIRHFEILVGQQSNRSPNSQYAQTHFLLGNLYEQSGDHERAMAAWQDGIERYPNDADLRKQMGLD